MFATFGHFETSKSHRTKRFHWSSAYRESRVSTLQATTVLEHSPAVVRPVLAGKPEDQSAVSKALCMYGNRYLCLVNVIGGAGTIV